MPRTFTTTVMASNADDAVARVATMVGPTATHRHAVAGFATTGRARVRSERHRMWDVEVADLGGDVDAWLEAKRDLQRQRK